MARSSSFVLRFLAAGALPAWLGLAACSPHVDSGRPGMPNGAAGSNDHGGAGSGSTQGGGGPSHGAPDFVSDAPGSSQNAPGAAQSGAGGASSDAGGPTSAAGDGTRAILEADVVQVRGDTLYALSRYGGLSVVDIADATHPLLRGRYAVTGVPFEMYVQGNVVFAMFSSFGHYAADANGNYKWVQSSHVTALDAHDPAHISALGDYDLAGEISDSRVVGNVLYAVTYEDGYCWNCGSVPSTNVVSIGIGDLTNIHVVDKLSYTSSANTYGWWRRSISVTPERIYVAGVEWTYNEGTGGATSWDSGHSTIQVVDISDPGGKLVEGAKVIAAGQIDSRWQMDEFQGVLRVISQPGVWASDMPPMMQTFTVQSSAIVTPLASKALTLPMPENLRTVRFDGPRAFAITAQNVDPLFTLDFSNPADPKQIGAVSVPGWVYHIEPRGDRLFTLGFDNQSTEGSLNVSLFDVSDLAHPTLVKRVAFGGSWGNFAEDQDRIHKAFNILADDGLILVPFGGWSYDKATGNGYYGCGQYKTGIQLIDFTHDALTLRGVAPQRGEARRAFLHSGSLFAVSDDSVRAFAIFDRDAPAPLSEVALAQKVDRTAAVGDKLVRLAHDWWTGQSRLEVAPLSDPETLEPLGTLDLAPLKDASQGACSWSDLYNARVFTNGTHVYLAWTDYNYGNYDAPAGGGTKGPSGPVTRVAVIDIADATHPTLAGSTSFTRSSSGYGYYGYGYDGYGYGGDALVRSGSDVAQVGTTLAFQDSTYANGSGGAAAPSATTSITLVDLAAPSSPRVASTLEVSHGDANTGLIVQGAVLKLSHSEPVSPTDSRVRFYLDQVDVTDVGAPILLPAVNTPGSLLTADGTRIVTVDYARVTTPNQTADECYKAGYDSVYFEYATNDCVRTQRTFRLVELASGVPSVVGDVAFPSAGYVTGVFVGDDRVFATVATGYPFAGGVADSAGGGAQPQTDRGGVFALGGIRAGAFRGTYTKLASSSPWWSSFTGFAASGARLVLGDYGSEPHVAVFDASDIDAPKVDERGKLRGYLYDLSIVGNDAICSLGDFGVQRVSLTP